MAKLADAQTPPGLWGVEQRFELDPSIQQASSLPTELHCTLIINLIFAFFVSNVTYQRGDMR